MSVYFLYIIPKVADTHVEKIYIRIVVASYLLNKAYRCSRNSDFRGILKNLGFFSAYKAHFKCSPVKGIKLASNIGL